MRQRHASEETIPRRLARFPTPCGPKDVPVAFLSDGKLPSYGCTRLAPNARTESNSAIPSTDLTLAWGLHRRFGFSTLIALAQGNP